MKRLIILLSLLVLTGCVVGGSIGIGNSGASIGVGSGIAF